MAASRHLVQWLLGHCRVPTKMHCDRHRSAYLINRLIASDPSLERLRSGLRALLTAGILAALFLPAARLAGVEYKHTLGGILVAMIAAVTLQDPGRRQQQWTMAWAAPVGSAMLVLGSLVREDPWLSGGCFLLIIFCAFQARRLGPRGSGLGAIAYQSYFYALLLKTPPGKAAWLPLFVAIGCAVAYAVRFWLVPEHPGAMLRSELRAWHARIAALVHDLARQVELGGEAGRKRVDAQLAQLNAQSLALESRLADFACEPDAADGLRARVLRGELAVEALVAVMRAASHAGDDDRARLAGELRALERGLDEGAAFDTAGWQARLGHAAQLLPAALRWRLSQTAHELAGLPSTQQAMPAMRDERRPAPPQAQAKAHHGDESAADAAKPPWLDDTTRRALQACAAALGAIVAGRALSPSHWFWAVFAAFLMFTRTATIGQTVSGAWRQVLATVGGVCLGIATAELVHGDRATELALLFVFVGLGFYAFRGLQNAYVVLLSAMLAMLYELMGMNSPGLLLLRLEETAIGALAAILSARLVLPVHTRDASRGKTAELLRAAGRLLQSAWTAPHQGARHAAMRDLDRRLETMRQTLGPVTGADYPGSKKHRRRHLHRLARVTYCVRHCCDLIVNAAPQLAQSTALREAADLVASRMDETAALFEAPESRSGGGPDAPIRLPADDAHAAQAGHYPNPEPMRIAMRWLADIDAILRAMQAGMAPPGTP